MATNKQDKKANEPMQGVESALSRTEQFIEENQKSITIIIVAIAALILIYIMYKKLYVNPKEIVAQEQMFVAEQYFEKDSFRLALDGDGNYPGFLEIIDEYGVTKAANLAHYYCGVCYLQMGQYEEAIEHLEKFDSDDPMVGPIAYGAIGDAYVELGNNQQAVKFFMKAAKKESNDFTAPIYYMKAGQVYEALGEYGKALKVYETIENEFPKSSESRQIEKYKARVQIKMKG